MTVKSRPRARRLPPIATSVAVVLTLGAIAFACADTRRTLGEDCLKDVDCQSSICTGGKCTSAPPILDRDASAIGEAGPDVAAEAGDAADGAPDAPAEATSDAAAD